jgi:hypothetical protein
MSENNKYYFSLLFCIVLSLVALAAPAAAQVSAPPTAGSYGMTSGRLVASTSVVLALVGVVIGGLALLRPNGRFGTASGRLGAVVALAGGLIGTAVGGWVAATVAATAGGIGTGGGLAGAIVALVLGLIAMALGGLALSRSRDLS